MSKRALISLSDKTGAIEFAQGLEELGFEIVSTGGTLKMLTDNNIKAISISDITGFPECLDGRVKTLHPSVHAGLLAVRNNPEHIKQLEDLNITPIDVVAVNLYPFKKAIEKDGVSLEEAVENIDIGGPTMLRSAAKNYQDVLVLCDPKDYPEALQRLKNDTADKTYRMGLMYKVYRHTAVYDTLISNYLAEKLNIEYPDQITMAYEKQQSLRYGENPHQTAAFYKEIFSADGSLTKAKQLHGKELSYNNINDTNGAIELLKEFEDPAIVAVKHSNPCGVAVKDSILEAYKAAYECDPVSIYGGIIAANREMDYDTALLISKIFVEIVIAPSFSKEALAVLSKKPSIRLLELSDIVNRPKTVKDQKKVLGGLLVQQADYANVRKEDLEFVTKAKPTKEQIDEMLFAFKVVKHCKSNAIMITKDFATIGGGIGQVNRIWAVNQAIEHAGDRVKGSVLASDAFFPFADSVQSAHKAGVAAIIQPGGSTRDQESIDFCDSVGLPMVFTKMRHFRH